MTTHCKNGHERTEENTRINPVYRTPVCRTCMNESSQRSSKREKERDERIAALAAEERKISKQRAYGRWSG